MARIDRRIFKSKIVEARASFGPTHDIRGAFFRQPREVAFPEGAVQSVQISFECQYVSAIAQLQTGDTFSVEGYGSFRFLRELLPGGDESGLTVIELGEKRSSDVPISDVLITEAGDVLTTEDGDTLTLEEP
jgi:hypothetical protein